MFLFPYRAQIKLHKWPVITIAISLLCLAIYLAQAQSESRVEAYAEAFSLCRTDPEAMTRIAPGICAYFERDQHLEASKR